MPQEDTFLSVTYLFIREEVLRVLIETATGFFYGLVMGQRPCAHWLENIAQ
jgi:hypothetical protein